MSTSKTYDDGLLTIYETSTFVEDAELLWSTEERLEFFGWLAANPLAGDVVPGSGGCRKVRWARSGSGKSGGARAIYFTRLDAGELWLLLGYAKSVRVTIPGRILKLIRKELDNGC